MSNHWLSLKEWPELLLQRLDLNALKGQVVNLEPGEQQAGEADGLVRQAGVGRPARTG